jgi:hypothetical protein
MRAIEHSEVREALIVAGLLRPATPDAPDEPTELRRVAHDGPILRLDEAGRGAARRHTMAEAEAEMAPKRGRRR